MRPADSMLFNSHEYIFIFLPLTAIIYFFFNRFDLFFGARIFLLTASLLFYGWTHPVYVPLLLGSIFFNYVVIRLLAATHKGKEGDTRSLLLVLGITGNLSLLAYFKYADFFISNINQIGGFQISLLHLLLPGGLSFFTLNQISCLVDSWRGKIAEQEIQSYVQFVSFFPYILAGPIVRYEEVVHQLTSQQKRLFNYKNISEGAYLFFIGLFKKTVFADSLAVWANNGFDTAATLTFLEAWVTSLSYTFQLYFDFSGYTDMALGCALIFNITLPINFDSPYKSFNIQDFWRRWHITLGRFMRDYVYIPLGGSRGNGFHVAGNLMLVFLIIGVWHGAGWTFIIWGCMHGAAMVIHRLWKRFHVVMPRPIAWFLTFNFVNGSWIFFRAKEFGDAVKVFKGMAGMNGIILPENLSRSLSGFQVLGIKFGETLGSIGGTSEAFAWVIIVFLVCLLCRNSQEMIHNLKPSVGRLVFISIITVLAILHLGSHSEFVYFRF